MRKRGELFIVGSVLVLAATACDQECSRMETLRTDAFAAEAWGVSQWLSVKNSARIKAPDWVRIVSDFK